MPSRKLTDVNVRTLPLPAMGQVDYFDSVLPSFGLRVSYGGAKSWFVSTRAAGSKKLVRHTLGRYPALSLAVARDRARQVLDAASRGIDPRKLTEKERAENARRASQTFGALSQEFLTRHGERNLRSSTVTEIRRAFSRLSTWAERPIEDITRRDVLSVIEDIEARGHTATADLTFAYLRKFFNWCVERDYLDSAPTDRIRRKRLTVSRDRVLKPYELAQVWRALDHLPYPFGPMFKLLALTGQRKGEVAGMRWDELRDWDTDKPVWELPGDRTKNGLSHLVPIVPGVKAIIDGCPRLGPHVFTTTGETPSSGFSKAKAQLDRLLPDLAAWRLHDLRRTMVTHMNERLSLTPHVVEAVINHISGTKAGVAGVYNRALYLEERRAALERWSHWMSALGGVEGRT